MSETIAEQLVPAFQAVGEAVKGRAPLDGDGKLSLAAIPDAIRPAKRIPIGAWTTAAGSGGATYGEDPEMGAYVRLSISVAEAVYRGLRPIGLQQLVGERRRVLSLAIRPGDNLREINIWPGSGWASGTGPRWVKSTTGRLTSGKWHRLTIPMSERDGAGPHTPDDHLKSLSIQVAATTGNTTHLDIADITIHETPARGRVGFIFDDAWLDNYTTAFPIMQAHGLAGGIAVEHAQVGVNPERCSAAQLAEMYAAGWDMHGHHHEQLPSLTGTQQHDIHRASKDFLGNNGFLRGNDLWVWPGGIWDTAAEDIALEYWRSLRRVDSFQRFGVPGVHERRDVPNAYVTSGVQLATLTEYVDRVVDWGGSLLIVFHKIVESPGVNIEWGSANFAALCDYIAAADVDMVAPSQILG